MISDRATSSQDHIIGAPATAALHAPQCTRTRTRTNPSTAHHSQPKDGTSSASSSAMASAPTSTSTSISTSMTAPVSAAPNGFATNTTFMLTSPPQTTRKMVPPSSHRTQRGMAQLQSASKTPRMQSLNTSHRLFFDYQQVTNISAAAAVAAAPPPAAPAPPPQPFASPMMKPSASANTQSSTTHNAPLPPIASPTAVLKPIDLNSALQPHDAKEPTPGRKEGQDVPDFLLSNNLEHRTTRLRAKTLTPHRHGRINPLSRNSHYSLDRLPATTGNSTGFSHGTSTNHYNTGSHYNQNPNSASGFYHRKRHHVGQWNVKRPGMEGRELSFDDEASLDTSMYTASPRASPESNGAGRISKSPTIVLRATAGSSPFPPDPPSSRQLLSSGKGRNHGNIPARSPNSMFRTWDGRTVQSKNPFSPMIMDGASTLHNEAIMAANCSRFASTSIHYGADRLSLPSSFSDSSSVSRNAGGAPFLRHKFKPSPTATGSLSITSPFRGGGANSANEGRIDTPGISAAINNTGNDSSNATGTGTGTGASINTNANSHYHNYNAQQRPGRPSKEFSFTGSPILESSQQSDNPTSFRLAHDDQYYSHSSKVRRLTKDDDVASHATNKSFDDEADQPRRMNAFDEVGNWKRLDLHVKTNSPTDDASMMDATTTMSIANSTIEHTKQEANCQVLRRQGVSPTDVLSFPSLPSPSSPSPIPPATPMKQPRGQFSQPPFYQKIHRSGGNEPAVGYASIRKSAAPPPTPLPNRNRRRRQDAIQGANGTSVNRRSLSPSRGLAATPTSTTTIRHAFSRDDDSDSCDFDGMIGMAGGRHDMTIMSGGSHDSGQNASRFTSDFDIIGELGKGSFGSVYKVLSKFDGCLYAIKAAHRPAKGAADKDRMLKEVYALAALSDQADTATFHIVRYHQAWMEDQRLYIQTELCTSTLADELKCGNPTYKTEARRYKCLREILIALEYIHRNGMVHLDIKPENIFLKNDQHKLGDFGLVSEISYHKDVEEGDSRYMSMELLSGDHDDLTKSDVFSLGITLFEVCLGGAKSLPTNGSEWQALRSGTFEFPPSDAAGTLTGGAASKASPSAKVSATTITPRSSLSSYEKSERDLHRIIRQMMNPCVTQRPSAKELLTRPQLLSEEQKALLVEKNKVLQASLALVAQQQKSNSRHLTPLPKRKGLVRSNTWTGG